MTAQELAAAARRSMNGSLDPGPLAGGHGRASFGSWPRASALLARQALEQGLDDLWGAVAPRAREAPRRAQLLCLGAYLQDDGVVSGVRYAWHGLSRACHHQDYELPPTATELARWLDAVDALLSYDPIRSTPSSRPRPRSPA